MNFWNQIKKQIKIKLSGLVKPEWRYFKILDEIISKSKHPIVPDGPSLFDHIINDELKGVNIRYFEFGVFEGKTIKYWVNNYHNPETEFYGFDTFTGLPEDWNARKKGSYSAHGNIPVIKDDRVKFIKGLFQDTVPLFLDNKKFSDKRSVLHLDADLYSSTLFVLSSFLPFLKKNDILIFDEFGIELNHEFRAFIDFVDMSKIKYELICSTGNYVETAIRIL